MKKILVIRLSAIGDIVITSPVLRCLKSQMNCEIHFLLKDRFRSVIEANPHVDKIHSVQKRPMELLTTLKAENFDLVIDLQKNRRTIHFCKRLNRPYYSFQKLNLEKWIWVNFKVDRMPDKHLVHRYFEGLEQIGLQYDGQGLDFFISEEEEIDLDEYNIPNVYGVFAIGAAHQTKKMPMDLIKDMLMDISSKVVLVGGPDEAAAGESIANANPNHVINLCGKLSISGSASVIRQAEFVLSHDTGMMHIAAAYHKKLISIWGNTHRKLGFYPLYPDGMNIDHYAEVDSLACRPCSKLGKTSCPKGHFNCMRKQDIPGIVALVNGFFDDVSTAAKEA